VAGCDNSLGIVKFDFDNPFTVYLHDTNAKKLFQKGSRWLSHGCIRLEKPTELAEKLLGNFIDSEASCPAV
jgi:murein L,D-transpeptidase YcbB/YkuD